MFPWDLQVSSPGKCVLQTHHCSYFTGQLTCSQTSRSYWNPSFPVWHWQCQEHKCWIPVPWAESWEVTQSPRQCRPSPILSPGAVVGATAELWGHRSMEEHSQARMVPACQGCSCPGSAARAPPVLQTLNDTSLLHKKQAIFTTVSANDG